MESATADRPARESRDPCWSPDCTRPTEPSTVPLTCDSSRLSDRNWASSRVPALVLILRSTTPTRTVPARIVAAATGSAGWASRTRRASQAIGTWARPIHPRRHPASTADASPVVVACRAKTMRWVQHMRYNWWVVSIANYSDPCLIPAIQPGGAFAHRSDASGDFGTRRSAIAKCWAMS